MSEHELKSIKNEYTEPSSEDNSFQEEMLLMDMFSNQHMKRLNKSTTGGEDRLFDTIEAAAAWLDGDRSNYHDSTFEKSVITTTSNEQLTDSIISILRQK